MNGIPDIWDVGIRNSGRNGVYVAVSGNTAAGKSSLISEAARALRDRGFDAVGISERSFHHQYLKLMFAQPEDFAFPIQLSFMLNRHMVLLRNLVELGRIVIMERSHFDDALFADEHAERGAITPEQRRVYGELARVLHARIPRPDVLVLMNSPPELSIRRLRLAEESGERDAEFPSEEAKAAWIYRWHSMYEALHARYRAGTGPEGVLEGASLIDADPASPLKDNVKLVLAEIDRRFQA